MIALQRSMQLLKMKLLKNVAVIGAGNGISAAEVFAKAGKNVTLIDGGQKPLENYLNDTYTSLFEKELTDHGVNLAMNTKVTGFVGNGKVNAVQTDKGDITADCVIITVGIKPNTDWLKTRSIFMTMATLR